MICSFPLCKSNVYANGYCINHNRVYGNKVEKAPAKKIPSKSDTRKEEEKIYNAAAKQYKIDNPKCMVKDCDRKTEHVHHMRGRSGSFYLDQSTWLPVCMNHHLKIEANPVWSKENGYSLNRNS